MRLRHLKSRADLLRARAGHLLGSYHCAVCGRRIRSFQPLPAYYRSSYEQHGWAYRDAETLSVEAYSCPLCGASDRDRLCALYLRQRLVPSGDRVTRILDIAPSGPLRRFVQRLIQDSDGGLAYRTADREREDVDDRLDITDMRKYHDGAFDVLLCCHVLEHVSDDRRALQELHRILSPGGWGILLVPILLTLGAIDEDPGLVDVAERWRRFGQDDHVRCYSKAGFLQRVMDARFHVRSLGVEHFGHAAFTRDGITERSVLYVIEK